jgi:hypothetical protein
MNSLENILDLMKRLGKLGSNDFDGRELICTPYEGNYGIAGWVLCINGSPPRGTLIVPQDHSQGRAFYLESGDWGCRKISSEKHMSVISAFHREYLNHTKTALQLGHKPDKPDTPGKPDTGCKPDAKTP